MIIRNMPKRGNETLKEHMVTDKQTTLIDQPNEDENGWNKIDESEACVKSGTRLSVAKMLIKKQGVA